MPGFQDMTIFWVEVEMHKEGLGENPGTKPVRQLAIGFRCNLDLLQEKLLDGFAFSPFPQGSNVPPQKRACPNRTV